MKFNETISKLIENQYFYVFLAVVILIVVLLILLIASKNLREFFIDALEKIKALSFSKTKTWSMGGKKTNHNTVTSTVIKGTKIKHSELEGIGGDAEIENSEITDSKIGFIGSKKDCE